MNSYLSGAEINKISQEIDELAKQYGFNQSDYTDAFLNASWMILTNIILPSMLDDLKADSSSAGLMHLIKSCLKVRGINTLNGTSDFDKISLYHRKIILNSFDYFMDGRFFKMAEERARQVLNSSDG